MKPPETPANSRGVAVIRSWLDATAIPYVEATEPGADLAVPTTIPGVSLNVAVTMGKSHPSDRVLSVPFKEITSTDMGVALAAFHRVTFTAGRGAPIPVDRGAVPDHKLRYDREDEFDLVVFRHREFRMAPNPDPEKLAQYREVYEVAGHLFFGKNKRLCHAVGVLPADLVQIARVWTVTFLSRYAIVNPTEKDANARLLVKHLRQRFAELHTTYRKKLRCVSPDADTASFSVNEDVEEPSDEWKASRSTIKKKSPTGRRKEAATMLNDLLGQMPHDKLVDVLTHYSTSVASCPDTRTMAAKKLKEHVASCASCAASQPSGNVEAAKKKVA